MATTMQNTLDILYGLNLKINYEILPIENSLDRVCAEDIYAKSFLPKFNNSAMDGYALIYEDKDNELKVIDTILAGDNNNKLLEKNSCIKIMTGAKIPENATAIIPKEETIELNDNKIKILKNIKKFQHIRYIGEDIQKNEILIKKGENVNFSKITLLSSQGISHIKVFKKPKVIVFASGEELKLHYEKIEDYQIYNSNTPTFVARTKELGCQVNFIGQAQDNVESIKELIQNSLDADLIITSGGVSVGDADFTKESFLQLNFETIINGIDIKPGKPTIFGKINDTFILNLPGNPLAASLIFELFGKIIIQKLLGATNFYHNFIYGKLKENFTTKKGKTTIIPGFFDGEYFEISEKRSAGMVSTLSSCNSMLVLNSDVENLKKDNLVKILPIDWKFFTDIKKDFLTNE